MQVTKATFSEFDVILGNNTQKQFGINVIDYPNNRLKLGSSGWITIYKSRFDYMAAPFRVYASEKYTIPPRTETIIMATINKEQTAFYATTQDENSWLLYEPDQQKLDSHELIGARTLCTFGDNLHVKLLNATHVPITIYPYTRLGWATRVDNTALQSLHSFYTQEDQTVNQNNQFKPPQFEFIEDIDFSKSVMTEIQKEAMINLIKEYHSIFAKSDTDLGRTSTITHKIETFGKPVKSKPYRVPYHMRIPLRAEIDRLERAGIISPSKSDWCSPVLCVIKTDNRIRLVTDLRQVNKQTKRDCYSLKRVDDVYSLFNNAKWFTTLDLSQAFLAVPMSPDSAEKTAFITQDGVLMQHNFMPFGAINSSATWNRLADIVLSGLQYNGVIAYVDDFLLYSTSFAQHLQHIQQVFERIKMHGLKLKGSKCCFCREEVDYLGHSLSAAGIRPSDSKIRTIKSALPPKDKTELKSWLGLVNFFRKYIKSCAQICRPLTELTRENVKFIWTEKCTEAFEILKDRLTKPPVLMLPDFTKQMILHCDASDYSVGSVLSQKDSKGHERVIGYASKTLSKAEKLYPVCEREALALLFGVKHFYPYLWGRPFRLTSDHMPLRFLLSSCNLKGRLGRWAMLMQSMPIEIEYIEGSKNQSADACSRLRHPDDDKEQETMVTDELVPVYVNLPEIDSQIIERSLVEQRMDKELKPLIEYLEKGEIPKQELELNKILNEKKLFQLINGRLYYRTVDRRGQRQFLLVIPQSLKGTVLQHCHDSLVSGHGGIFKTENRVRDNYYWNSLSQDVQKYCAACPSCATSKDPKKLTKVPLYPIKPQAKFESFHSDAVGPLPLTQNGNKFYMTFVEAMTRHVTIVPVPDLTGETTSRAFVNHIILKVGVPKYLVSDNGKNYTSALLKGIEALLGVRAVYTLPYNPKANSKSERIQKDISKAITHYINQKTQRDWDLIIPYIELALNTSVSSTLHDSPFYLLYLTDCQMPLSASLDLPRSKYRELEDYKLEMQELFRDSTECVRQATLEAQRKQEFYYNRDAEAHTFATGDLVYMYNPQIAKSNVSKFTKKWKGPFRVMDIEERKALLRLANNRLSKSFWCNVNRLKRCMSATTLQFIAPDPISEGDNVNDQSNKTLGTKKQMDTNRNNLSIASAISNQNSTNTAAKATDEQTEKIKTEIADAMKTVMNPVEAQGGTSKISQFKIRDTQSETNKESTKGNKEDKIAEGKFQLETKQKKQANTLLQKQISHKYNLRSKQNKSPPAN